MSPSSAPMSNDQRAVNTVADVSLALLFVGIAVTVLAAFPMQGDEYDPHQSDYTADTVGGSTLNVSYSLEEVPSIVADDFDDSDQFGRASHGSIASQIGDAAVANGRFDGGPRLTSTGRIFERQLDERVQASLVESRFRTNVTATWEPFEGASLGGRASVGQVPPATDDVSASSVRVPSGMARIRPEATRAVESGGGYRAVATLLADAVLDGYVPVLESKRALERDGPERTLTRRRYQRMATGIDGVGPDDDDVVSNLRLHAVDTAAVNDYLADELADQFESELAASFESPEAAARAITVGEVRIAVRTWEP